MNISYILINAGVLIFSILWFLFSIYVWYDFSKRYKWFREEFIYLKYKVESKKNSENVYRERIRLK